MRTKTLIFDYEPVTRSQTQRPATSTREEAWQPGEKAPVGNSGKVINGEAALANKGAKTVLKHGHALTYAGLFLFTIVLYARPSEFYPSPVTASIALIIGVITLSIFAVSQLSLEGTLTAPLREIKLILLLALTGLLSVPLAMNPSVAWHEFSSTFIRCVVMFIVMVNAVRTEARLKGLLFLALAAAIWLSVGALNDYRLGLLTVEGYRASGTGGGIFGNTNDMALHLVTILPISIALLFSSRGIARRLLYGVCAALMMAAIVLSYSRGAFIGLVVILLFLAMRLGRRNRLGIALGILVIGAGFLLFAPGNYGARLLSILIPSLDPVGSADARRGELFRSLYVALRHPFLGIGMGNYGPEMSYHGLVTHNAYTQVAAEMGIAALVCYTMFIVSPLRKLGQIVRETFDARDNSHFYYMSVGLQAALIGYMVSSFFLSVAYTWYVFFLVGYAIGLRRLYESETGQAVVVEERKKRKESVRAASLVDRGRTVTT